MVKINLNFSPTDYDIDFNIQISKLFALEIRLKLSICLILVYSDSMYDFESAHTIL